MKKVVVMLLVVSMLAWVFAGCAAPAPAPAETSSAPAEPATEPAEEPAEQPAEEPAVEEPASSESYRVAFIVKTLNNPFFVDMQTGAQEAADELGVELFFTSPDNDTDIEQQIQILENCIAEQYDAIVLSAIDNIALNATIKKVNDANIPIVIVNDNLDWDNLAEEGGDYLSYVGIDQIIAAEHAGNYVLENYPDGAKIAILEGVAGTMPAIQRVEGFKNPLTDAKYEFLVSQTANWDRSEGFNVFQNILTSHPEVNLLYACNDEMALGAIEAIELVGRTGEIGVIGFDATDDAKVAIEEGTMLGSVAQYPADMGYRSVETCVNHLNGEEVEKTVITKTELITKDLLG